MNVPKIRMVKIKDIKRARYNPPGRTKKVQKSLLIKSLEEEGLQYPLLVTKDNELVDGHRRLAAGEALGWTEFPCIETATPQTRAYAAVNSTNMRMMGADILHIYFSEPDALTPQQRGRVDSAIEQVGMDVVKELHKEGYSLRLVNKAREVSLYCGKEGRDFQVAVVRYGMEHGLNTIERAVVAGTKVSVIVKAVTTSKELKVTVK